MRSIHALLFAVLLLACGHAAKPPPGEPRPPAPELAQIDVFGSRQLDRETVIARWGDRLVELIRAMDGGEFPGELKDAVEAEIRAAGTFAFVDLGVIGYFEPKKTYVTIDLVDEADRDRRMTFSAEPTGELPDPDGLIALWGEYQDKVMTMLSTGAIKPAKAECPFWHCITFAHESLTSYRDAFAKRVPPVERELAAVLRDDNRRDHRAAAAFLLAHIASGERVVELMLPAIRDPDEIVRNNSMRVLALIADGHPEIAIPVEPILDALQFPTTTDRNKAAAILEGITRRDNLDPAVRGAIVARVGTTLVDMLALRQPNNHDYAYQILKHLSGKDLGEHAVDAWREWLRL
jgi:hypothetical protein